MMFSVTKKFTIAMFVFFSVQFAAYGTSNNDAMGDEKGKQCAVINISKQYSESQAGLPPYIMKEIFIEACKNGADPRDLECICKHWYDCMRYQIPDNGPPTSDKAGIPYTTKLNCMFMEDCMRVYREFILSQATLVYKKGIPQDERVIKFSDFKDGMADLSNCADETNRHVFTTIIERFFEDSGNKLVTFIGPHHMVQNLLPTSPKTHVVILWRWGNWITPEVFDYQASRGIDELSNVDLHENWKMSTCSYRYHTQTHAISRPRMRTRNVKYFSCLFVNQN